MFRAFRVHWQGFHEDATFEVALVSEKTASLIDVQCTRKKVSANWKAVGRATSMVHSSLPKNGKHAFLVKAILPSGEEITARSDGFQVLKLSSTVPPTPISTCPCSDTSASLPPRTAPLPINRGTSSTVSSSFAADTGYSGITKAGIVIGTVVGSAVLIAAIIAALGFMMGSGGYGDSVVASAPASGGGVHHEFFPHS